MSAVVIFYIKFMLTLDIVLTLNFGHPPNVGGLLGCCSVRIVVRLIVLCIVRGSSCNIDVKH